MPELRSIICHMGYTVTRHLTQVNSYLPTMKEWLHTEIVYVSVHSHNPVAESMTANQSQTKL